MNGKPDPGYIYSSFMFLKLDPAFRRLVSNEKIAAKQEFENVIASCQEKVFLRTYMITGLSSGADILFWRVSHDLEKLQDACTKAASAGAGRWLDATHSFLGVYPAGRPGQGEMEFGFIPKDRFGRHKFMLVHPVIKDHSWYELPAAEREKMIDERKAVLARYGGVQETIFLSYGLDEWEMIVSREARALEELVNATKELKELRIKGYTATDKPVYFCVGRDLAEIMDALS